MFIKKTQAEIQAMTDEQAETYAAAKEANDISVAKENTANAVKTAIDAFKNENDLAIKTAKEATEKTIADLENVVKTQGEAIKNANDAPKNVGLKMAKELEEQLKEISVNSQEKLIAEKVKLKAFTSDNAISVGSFPNAAGNGTIVGAIGNIANYFVQLIAGIFAKPIPKSNILDYVDMLPLSGDRLVSISETETINIAVTAEGVAKPVSSAKFTDLSADAQVVSTLWKTTNQMRKFYLIFVNFFLARLTELFDKSIPAIVWGKIQANTTAFTPVAAQVIYVNPNNYDAIVACIASLVKLGYMPNVCFISPFAWENMKGLKASDGHYLLANNGSINLLEGTINFGKISVKIEIDLELTDDAFVVGDFKTCVKVAMDNNLDYVEAYVGNDLELNLKSHRLEKYVAVNIPFATKSGIISDTFTNVKTLITKP